jgi:proline racemase
VIDARRWTANEREVLRDALRTERRRQHKRQREVLSPLVQSDAQWRLVVIGQALDAIGES